MAIVPKVPLNPNQSTINQSTYLSVLRLMSIRDRMSN